MPKKNIKNEEPKTNENPGKQIKMVNRYIKDLNLDFGNPRSIDKESVESLKKSISQLGDFGVVVIDENNSVISGNQRVKAMKELGIEVPIDCKQIIGYNLKEKKAINIRANKSSGIWNQNELMNWIQELNLDNDFDVTLTGFETIELKDFNIDFDAKKCNLNVPNSELPLEKGAKNINPSSNEEDEVDHERVQHLKFTVLVDDYVMQFSKDDTRFQLLKEQIKILKSKDKDEQFEFNGVFLEAIYEIFSNLE